MRRVSKILSLVVLSMMCAATTMAADLQVPSQAVAGSSILLTTSGSGEATLILIGPNHIAKRKLKLGEQIEFAANDIVSAGRYLAILRSQEGDSSKWFQVLAAPVSQLSFVTHPSRAPVAQRKGIHVAVYPFDSFENLVLQPVNVNLQFFVNGELFATRSITTQGGVAYSLLDSPQHEGAAHLQAAAGQASATRVIRLVAAEACNLRIKAASVKDAIEVQTEPVRDCSGNLVPDGTVVTFTQIDQNGRSTVDAGVKHGIAIARFPAAKDARISAASGVAAGNEIRWRSF